MTSQNEYSRLINSTHSFTRAVSVFLFEYTMNALTVLTKLQMLLSIFPAKNHSHHILLHKTIE